MFLSVVMELKVLHGLIPRLKGVLVINTNWNRTNLDSNCRKFQDWQGNWLCWETEVSEYWNIVIVNLMMFVFITVLHFEIWCQNNLFVNNFPCWSSCTENYTLLIDCFIFILKLSLLLLWSCNFLKVYYIKVIH